MNRNNTNPVSPGGIVLFAKLPGKTSFSSLYTIKHALKTKKVGHTGTLDSFAQGLLVVMTGSHTRLAQRVTAFDKKYEAIIQFGSETDSLDVFGEVTKKAPLPTKKNVFDAVEKFCGRLMQSPPSFSAVHVNGKRASDLARAGKQFEIPKRPITVYSAKIKELRCNSENLVEYAHVVFHVSKGTYIRCLARDIGIESGSVAHLIGLLRTSVGSFKLEDAAGSKFLPSFTIKTVVQDLAILKSQENDKNTLLDKDVELLLQKEVIRKLRYMDTEIAKECGFYPVHLREDTKYSFFNGKPLKENFFIENIKDCIEESEHLAVFCEDSFFAGEVVASINNKTGNLYLKYGFVIPLTK